MTSVARQWAVGSRQSGYSDGSDHIRSYRDLRVWQSSIELTVDCYEATKAFPPSETYGLASQARRSATSIPANIAEGYGRESRGAYQQFLRVAQGSLKELETHLIVAERLGYLDARTLESLISRAEEIGKMLRGLIRRLEKAT